MIHSRVAGAVSLLCLGLAAGMASAQTPMNDPSYCDVMRALGTPGPECGAGAAAPGTTAVQGGPGRGLSIQVAPAGPAAPAPAQPVAGAAPRVAPAQPAAPAAVAPAAPAPPPTREQPRVATFGSIQFALGSAELLPNSISTLDTLAAVLKAPSLASQIIVVEGHTDASGSEQYNQALSERRALAVVGYLVANHAIDPQRLEWVGRGEAQPFDMSNPYSSINRRVAILNVGAPAG